MDHGDLVMKATEVGSGTGSHPAIKHRAADDPIVAVT